MRKILIAAIFLSVLASYASAAITCNPCNVGSCACSISDCSTGSLEVYSSSSCSSFPQYQFTFTGGSKTWSPVSAGTVYLKAFCDSGAQTGCTSVTVSAGGTTTTTTQPTNGPDLVVIGIRQDISPPGVWTEGQSLVYSAPVKNEGNIVAGSSTARFRLDINNDGTWDRTLGEKPIISLNPSGEDTEVSDVWVAVAGTRHKFETCADVNNVVTETNENNNCATLTFEVLPASSTTTTTTTSVTSTTTTTLHFEGVLVNITNNQLLINRTNEVRVLIGDNDCRIDRNNIYIKYTTLLPVKVDARKMICTDSKCVVQCTYSLAPDSDWKNPVELAVLVNLTGSVMTVEKNLALADASATTTTTTLRTNATTTTLGSTTTTVRSVDMRDIIPDLRKLQQDLNSVKADVDDLAERLRDIGDTRYRDYYTVSSDISDAVDEINVIIAAINKDPTSQANKQRVRNDLIALRQAIQEIADSL